MDKDLLEFMVGTARKAGEIQLGYFRGDDLSIRTKSNASDVVTRADKESEELIAAAITARYPDHKILGEEGGYRGNEASDYMWVVDPLDGTTNYSQGLPIFCVSIALTHKGEAIAGVVYAPYLDELYMAEKGGGARMAYHGGEAKPISVSRKQSLESSVIATGYPYDKESNPDDNADNVASILPHVRDLHRMGSAAYDLCCVACGTLDGYWEFDLKIWDVCAAELIVREAGGVVEEFRDGKRGVSPMAGNPTIVELIKKYVK